MQKTRTLMRNWVDSVELQYPLRELLDPTVEPMKKNRGSTDWGDQILDMIQRLLKSCYEFNINPLPDLRKLYPDLIWEFHEIRWGDSSDDPHVEMLIKLIKKSDFFWPVDPGLGYHWVIAVRKNCLQTPLSICGCRSKEFQEKWFRENGYSKDLQTLILGLYEKTLVMTADPPAS